MKNSPHRTLKASKTGDNPEKIPTPELRSGVKPGKAAAAKTGEAPREAQTADYSCDPRVAKVAEILVDYSIKVKPGERVYLSYPIAARELGRELNRLILKRGATAEVEISDPEIIHDLLTLGDEKQISYFPPSKMAAIKECQAFIGLGAPENPNLMNDVDPDHMALRSKTTRPFNDYRVDKTRWVITRCPTAAAASEAGMSESAYQNFVYGSIIQDWTKQNEIQDRIKACLDRAETVRIVGQDTDLTFSIKGRKAEKCVGEVNMPDGEVFCAPVIGTVNGKIKFTYPALYNGDIPDISLEYKNGKLIKYHTSGELKKLEKMLDTDEGSKYFGEFGIGTNYQIQKFTRNTLFDEKIGGTVHLALGKPYEGTGGEHTSNIHVDIVTDLRNGGAIYLDGKLFQQNGQFILP